MLIIQNDPHFMLTYSLCLFVLQIHLEFHPIGRSQGRYGYPFIRWGWLPVEGIWDMQWLTRHLFIPHVTCFWIYLSFNWAFITKLGRYLIIDVIIDIALSYKHIHHQVLSCILFISLVDVVLQKLNKFLFCA